MSNRRFGSANFLFLTAVLGMAGSAAASAAGNTETEKKLTKRDSSNLNAIDLVGMENKLVDAEVKTKKLLKLIALALGITTGTVTIGGVVYYFKDPEHRQKFLQAISERFGKGELSEKEIDKAIKELQPSEEEKKDLDQPEKNEVENNEEKSEETNNSEEQNEPNNAENVDQNTQSSTDEAENLLDESGNDSAFSAGTNSVYEYRNAILKLLPIVKGRVALSENSEELLTLLDKYGMFLGKDVFGDHQTVYAVFKMVHVLLILLNVVLSLIHILSLIIDYGNDAEYAWLTAVRGENEKYSLGLLDRTVGKLLAGDKSKKLRRTRFAFYTTKALKIVGYVLNDLLSIAVPAYSLVGVGLQGKSLYDARGAEQIIVKGKKIDVALNEGNKN